MKTRLMTYLISIASLVLLITLSLLFYSRNRNNDWIIKWLENPVCQPPCWDGITPGVTDIESAKFLLNQNTKIVWIDSDETYLMWEIEGDSGLAYTDSTKSETITRIQFDLSRPKLTLGQVISEYGDPTRVQVGDCIDQCVAQVFFEDKNMIIGLYLWPIYANEKVEITSSSKVELLYFFSSEMAPFPEKYLFSVYYSKRIGWKGYGIYP